MGYNCHINPETNKGWGWKGGRTRSNDYWQVRCLDHPYASKSGYIREHRLIMENKIGRYLLPGEEVHHIDGNTLNNDINNLQLLSKSEHARLHKDKWQRRMCKTGRHIAQRPKNPNMARFKNKTKTIIITTRLKNNP
jgi:HNH endonuclease